MSAFEENTVSFSKCTVPSTSQHFLSTKPLTLPHCYKAQSNWCNGSDPISLLAGYFIRISCNATSCVSEKNCFATS